MRIDKAVRRCERERLPDVAKQHVGSLHILQRHFVGFGDRFFDEALFEADPQVSCDDFDDVFRFGRRRVPKKLENNGQLGAWAASAGKSAKFFFQVGQSQFGRSLGEGGSRDRAEVSVGAVEVTELRVRFPGKF